jgi:formylglycine-generating enzyme
MSYRESRLFALLWKVSFQIAVMMLIIGPCYSAAPLNVEISCCDTLINLSWELKKDSRMYYIFKSYEPYGDFKLIDSTESNFYCIVDTARMGFYGVSVRTYLPENMIFVEGGTFIMGDLFREGYSDELPSHEVTVNNFYIQQTEVTQNEWIEVMGYNPCGSTWGLGDDYPVYNVNWYDAIVYCNKKSIRDGRDPCYKINGTTDTYSWGPAPSVQTAAWDAVVCDWNANGYRLLTEAEWEYAARGGVNNGDNYRYSGCMEEIELSEYAHYNSKYFLRVKSKLPNRLGIYDMTGNACEFCWDWYGYYTESKKKNPTGIKNVAQRVRKGGARYSLAKGCRISNRANYNPGYRYTGGEISFRIGCSDTSQNFYAITVVSPDGSDQIKLGSSVIVYGNDNFIEPVNVELYKNGIFHQTIKNSAPSTGQYYWVVSQLLDPLADYKIKIVKSDEPDVFDMSDESFKVVQEVPAVLTVLSPSSYDVWTKGRSQTIRFKDNFAENVKIELFKNGIFEHLITGSTESDGVFEWIPSEALKNHTRYSIRITRLTENGISSNSDFFGLKKSDPAGMVFVPGGSFPMGDVLSEGHLKESPVHQVSLDSFYIGKYEVSQAEWFSVMGSNPTKPEVGIGENFPVSNVSWYSVLVYCNKLSMSEGLTPSYSIAGTSDPALWGAIPTGMNTIWDKVTMNLTADGYRLPTEAEWEYAARGGDQFTDSLRYSGCHLTEELPSFCVSAGYDAGGFPLETGCRKPNQLGIYDMSGNIWEWCFDWWGMYSSQYSANPTGPAAGSYKVQRGGSFKNFSDSARISNRDFISTAYYISFTGFRLARSY